MSWFNNKKAVTTQKNDKILLVCRKRTEFYSSYNSTGLKTSALFVTEMLKKNGYDTKLVEVVDSNSLDKEITEFKPKIIIIEAFFVPPYKFSELKNLHPKVIFIVRCHSAPEFLAFEGIAYEWLFEYKKKGILFATNHENSLSAYNDLLKTDSTLLLPNYYPLERYLNIPKQYHTSLHIGCFGSIRPLKNQMNQALAAIKVAKKLNRFLNFHINSERCEGGGDPILKSLRALFKNHAYCAKLIEHPWLTHDNFLDVLYDMDVSMQVSLSETFNIVSADAVRVNVPILTSKEITWSPTQCDTHIDDIAHKLKCLLDLNDRKTVNLLLKQRNNLLDFNDFSNSMWLNSLEKLNL